MTQTNPIHKHAIHEGVDPQSWLGFEKRIEQRRFDSLLDVIRASLHGGDLRSAEAALSEARTLRPESPELIELELQAVALSAPSYGVRFWTRMGSAVVLLVVGISMMFALELLRRAPVAEVAHGGLAGAVQPQVADGAGAAPFASYRAGVESTSAATPAGTTSPAVATADPTPLTTAEPATAPSPVATADRAGAAPPPTATRTEPTRAAEPRNVATPSSERPSVTSANPSSTSAAATRSAAGTSSPSRTATATLPTSMRPAPVEVAPALPPASPSTSTVEPRVGESARGESRVAASELPARREAVAPTPATPPPAVAAVSAPVTSTPSGASRADETLVADVLQRYARAYGELDARAAREVWPTVDERALARAFDNLVSQQVSLRDCHIDVHGETADASCYGEARYIGKVGSGEPRTEPRAWRFLLRRDGDDWKIQTAQAQRASSASQ